MTLGTFRSFLYALARLLGDVQAVRGGSRTITRRLARRQAGRLTGKWLAKLFR